MVSPILAALGAVLLFVGVLLVYAGASNDRPPSSGAGLVLSFFAAGLIFAAGVLVP